MRVKSLIVVGMVLIWAGTLAGSVWAQVKTSGLPLPRFVSLRADKVNMRSGPGVTYPIEWVYQRESLPMEVVAEYGTWRRVRDWQGTQGWVHQSMLTGKRTFVVTGAVRTIRSRTDPDSQAVARVEPGVIGRLLGCPQDSRWCKVEAGGREGWLPRADFWGVYGHENF